MAKRKPPSPKSKPKPKAKARKKGSSRSRKLTTSIISRLKKFLLYSIAGFFLLSLACVWVYKYVNPPTTPLLVIRWAESGFDTNRPVLLGEWIALDDISPRLVRAVITSEDQKFEWHNGFDWVAVRHAIDVNTSSNRLLGASTISMQTARNVFLWQNRDWFRKGLEAYFTFLIEMIWSKQRILEVYLNIIEWGDGVFGCREAAKKHLKRSVERLSPLESAWLAAILPNPRKWTEPAFDKRVRGRQQVILRRMRTTSLKFLSSMDS